MIPYGKHFLDEDDIEAVVDVLRNGWLTQGPKVEEFERTISNYVGAKYAVAVSSGTAALHLACVVSGLKAGDEVFTSPNTFVASANCALYVGATPRFVDIDKSSLNIDVNLLQDAIDGAIKPKVVIPVHFAGLPCDMPAIKRIADSKKMIVIEDASHALGSKYENGHMVGSCEYSEMTVFSFHPVKGITSGEGGVITTNCETIYRKLLNFRSHGIVKGNFDLPGVGVLSDDLKNYDEAVENGKLKPWYYEMQDLGFNYRLTDIQSALAVSQMSKIDKFLMRRKELVEIYDRLLKDVPFVSTVQLFGRGQSSHHLYVVRIDFDSIKISKRELMELMATKGIGTQVHYIPVTHHPFYHDKCVREHYSEANRYYEEALTLPLYYELTNEEVETIVNWLTVFITEGLEVSKANFREFREI